MEGKQSQEDIPCIQDIHGTRLLFRREGTPFVEGTPFGMGKLCIQDILDMPVAFRMQDSQESAGVPLEAAARLSYGSNSSRRISVSRSPSASRP